MRPRDFTICTLSLIRIGHNLANLFGGEMSKHNEKTYIVCTQGIAAMWYHNQIIAAWEESSGERIRLWYAYVLTREIATAK